jgi:hypothetical protein
MASQNGGLLWADLSVDTLNQLDAASDPKDKIQ